jgi:diguanylate cyclase
VRTSTSTIVLMAAAALGAAGLAWLGALPLARALRTKNPVLPALDMLAGLALLSLALWWPRHLGPWLSLAEPLIGADLLATSVALGALLWSRSAPLRVLAALGIGTLGSLFTGLAAGPGFAVAAGVGEWVLLLALLGMASGVAAVKARPAQALPEPSPTAPGALGAAAVAGAAGGAALESPAEAAPLLDRGAFERQLDQALLAGQPFVLMRVDLDNVDKLLETLGQPTVERLLDKIGRRLRHLLRSADALSRLNDREFLLLVVGVAEQGAVEQLAQRVVNAVARPLLVDTNELRLPCTVGSVTGPGALDTQRLIGCTEQAVRQARRLGGARHRAFAADPVGQGEPVDELILELRRAIAGEGLSLHYQPKIDTRNGKVTAVEALVRWDHAKRGRISPGDFVPLAERSGLMVPLGDWVIDAACRQSRQWADKGLHMRVAINVSAQQMQQPDMARRLRATLERHGVPPTLITCEITESAAMQDTGATQQIFRELGELGVSISIDDFGTGYSSLAYLRKLPAEELKIDRAFVTDLGHSADARAVVDAVVQLAHALGLKVVAEGVETAQQQQMLTELGCDELQGYLLARPMTGAGVLLWATHDREHEQAFSSSLYGDLDAVHR